VEYAHENRSSTETSTFQHFGDEDGQVRLLDFGVAKLLEATRRSSRSSRMSTAGVDAGLRTPSCCAAIRSMPAATSILGRVALPRF